MKKINSIAFALAALTMTACDVFVDYESEYAHQNNYVRCSWQWPDQQTTLLATDRQYDMVTVLAVRTENRLTYYCETLRPASGKWTGLNHCDCPAKPSAWCDTVIVGNTSFKEGTYNFFTFNSPGNKARFKVDYSRFLNDDHDYFNNLLMTVNSYDRSSRSQEPSLQQYADIIDRNEHAGETFLPAFTNTIWYSQQNEVEVKGSGEVEFERFTKVTQDLSVTFDIDELSDYDMYIDTIRGSVSGAIATANIKSGAVKADKTHTVFFTLTTNDAYNKSQDIVATATMPVLGLLNNGESESNLCTLNLYLDVTYKDEDGVERNRMLTAAYPLDSLLRENPSVSRQADGTYRMAKKDLRLNIKEKLFIGHDYVDAPATSGYYQWTTTDTEPASANSGTQTVGTNE